MSQNYWENLMRDMWKHSIMTQGCTMMVVTWNYAWGKMHRISYTQMNARENDENEQGLQSS